MGLNVTQVLVMAKDRINNIRGACIKRQISAAAEVTKSDMHPYRKGNK